MSSGISAVGGVGGGGGGGGGGGDEERHLVIAGAGQTAFELPAAGFALDSTGDPRVRMYVEGEAAFRGSDFTVDGGTVTWTSARYAIAAGERVEFWYVPA